MVPTALCSCCTPGWRQQVSPPRRTSGLVSLTSRYPPKSFARLIDGGIRLALFAANDLLTQFATWQLEPRLPGREGLAQAVPSDLEHERTLEALLARAGERNILPSTFDRLGQIFIGVSYFHRRQS